MLPAGPRGGASTPTSQMGTDATGAPATLVLERDGHHGGCRAAGASIAVTWCRRETDARGARATAALRARATRSRGAAER